MSSLIQANVTAAPAATAVKDAPTPQALPPVDPSIPSAPGVTPRASAPSPRVLLQLLLLCIALLV